MMVLDPDRIEDVSFYVERPGRTGRPDTLPGAGPIEMFYLSVSMNAPSCFAVARPGCRECNAFGFNTPRT